MLLAPALASATLTMAGQDSRANADGVAQRRLLTVTLPELLAQLPALPRVERVALALATGHTATEVADAEVRTDVPGMVASARALTAITASLFTGAPPAADDVDAALRTRV